MTFPALLQRLRFRRPCRLPAAVCLALACAGPDAGRTAEAPPAADRLFTQLPASYTGVRFENRVDDTREHNVFTYRYYNGGGVALGDLTGDGLPEILLTANMGENHALPFRVGETWPGKAAVRRATFPRLWGSHCGGVDLADA